MNRYAGAPPHSTVHDESFGVIPIQYRSGTWWVLIIQHKQGHWAFPKGHLDGDESPREAAVRELLEETACRVIRFLDFPPLEEVYQFRVTHRTIQKKVTYFLAEAAGHPKAQIEELRDATWVTLAAAQHHVTFDQCRRMCQRVFQWLDGRTPPEIQENSIRDLRGES